MPWGYLMITDGIEYNQINSMRCFQNCLDYFHLENLEELINRSLGHQRPKKRTKVDPDRAAYYTLLDHVVSQLQRFRCQAEKNQKVRSPALLDLELITPISNELIQLTRRECTQRSTLFQIIFTFYKQALIIMDISCQETIKKALLEYFQNLEANRKQSENQINNLKNQLQEIKQENDEKWKTFYMIVKDNRVLRRQKGKLMRTLEEEKQKLCSVHEEMMELAKENQKNKLLANYGNNPESLSLFLKNTQAILKLDQYMKNYPKQTKKVLNVDLKKLQVSENIGLDEKIKYIIKAAKQSEEIFDEYEDLIDTNQRPNKLIFNISTQTDPFDIGLDASHFKVEQLKPLKKLGRNVQCQTHHRHLKLDTGVLMLTETIVSMPESKISRRRKALKTNAVEDLTLIDAVKHFKENMICRKVCNVKIFCKNPNLKLQNFQSNIYNLAINYDTEQSDFPTLTTNHKLQFDIKRSKEFIRKQQERRSSRKSDSHRSSIDANIAVIKVDQGKFDISKIKVKDYFRELTEEGTPLSQQQQKKIAFQSIETAKQNVKTNILKRSEKKPQQKYILNSPMNLRSSKKLTEIAKSFENRKLTQNTSTNESMRNNNTIISLQSKKVSQQKKTLKQLVNRPYKKQNDQNQQIQSGLFLKQSQAIAQRKGFQISQNINKRQIRKSGFAAYKKSNTVPDGLIIQQLSSRESAKKSHQEQRLINSQNDDNNQISPYQNQPTVSKQSSNIKNTFSYFRKSSSRVKVINIYACQSSKLINKIYKYIFNKRRQIAESTQIFETFLNSYIKTQYGLSQKVVINTHFTRGNCNKYDPLVSVFDILMNKTLSNEYLQHLFKTFARLLIISGYEYTTLPYSNGIKIQEELLKIHFSEVKYREISENNSIFHLSSTLNICQSFLNLDYQLRRQLQDSQIGKFLKKLLPFSQQTLSYQQLKQILSLFIFQEKYYIHLITLKKYCNPQISIQNICFYAIKQEWKPLHKVQDYIIENYEKYSLIIQGLGEKKRKNSHQRFEWTNQLIKEKQKSWNNEIVILRKYQSVLQVNDLLEKNTSVSRYLLDIQNQCSILNLKTQLKVLNF